MSCCRAEESGKPMVQQKGGREGLADRHSKPKKARLEFQLRECPMKGIRTLSWARTEDRCQACPRAGCSRWKWDAKWNVLVLLNIFTLLVCLLSVKFVYSGGMCHSVHIEVRGQPEGVVLQS